MRHKTCVALGVVASLATISGCDFDSELAPRVELGVIVDGTGVRPIENDLGYQIEFERCRVAVENIEFTTEGEMHADASAVRSLYDLVIPTAYAHPGHSGGGEVVGELAGQFVFDWREDGRVLGLATMLHADYSGANFTFGRAQPAPGVEPDDPIVGHTFHLAGTATRDGETVHFEALVDQDEDRGVFGIPMDLSVDESSDEVMGLSLEVADVEADTLMDGLDFIALDEDGDGEVSVEAGTEAYNRLRRNLQVHDHYELTTR